MLDGSLRIALEHIGDGNDPDHFAVAGDRDGGFGTRLAHVDVGQGPLDGYAMVPHQA